MFFKKGCSLCPIPIFCGGALLNRTEVCDVASKCNKAPASTKRMYQNYMCNHLEVEVSASTDVLLRRTDGAMFWILAEKASGGVRVAPFCFVVNMRALSLVFGRKTRSCNCAVMKMLRERR